MKMLKVLACVVAIAAAQGCAFTPAKLDVAATPETKVAGPLNDVQSLHFNPPQLEDARLDKARIGWKKNGYGQNTADITTVQTVDGIVENAIVKAITDSRHLLSESGAIGIVGSVDRFWFDMDVNMWTVKFIGDVQCTLEFIDTQTKQSIYKSKYSGNYAEEKAGGLEKTWTVVMSKAIDKLIEDVVLDDELAQALRDRYGRSPDAAP